jgi:hypothetical protein
MEKTTAPDTSESMKPMDLSRPRPERDTPLLHVFSPGDVYYTNASLQFVKVGANIGDMLLLTPTGLDPITPINITSSVPIKTMDAESQTVLESSDVETQVFTIKKDAEKQVTQKLTNVGCQIACNSIDSQMQMDTPALCLNNGNYSLMMDSHTFTFQQK